MADRTDEIIVFMTLAPWTPPPNGATSDEQFQTLYRNAAEHFPNLSRQEFAVALKRLLEGLGSGQPRQ